MFKIKSGTRSAFTLVEIIVVLVILGLLAAIALPGYFKMVNKSRSAAALAALHGFKQVVDACVANKTLSGQEAQCALIQFPPDTKDGFSYDFLDSGGVSHAPGSDVANPKAYTIYAHYTGPLSSVSNHAVALANARIISGQPTMPQLVKEKAKAVTYPAQAFAFDTRIIESVFISVAEASVGSGSQPDPTNTISLSVNQSGKTTASCGGIFAGGC